MDWDILKSNWALAVAAVLGIIIALVTLVQLFRRSAAGQLRKTVATLAKAQQDAAKILKSLAKAERIAKRLHDNADRAKPRHLQEAKEALGDARALAKIANDKVLVAENHVRRVIHEEYPPRRQEALRRQHLPSQERDKRPFSF